MWADTSKRNEMKILIFLALLITGQAYAQQKKVEVSAFEAKMKGENIEINWKIAEGDLVNYWEVQGSRDGKEYIAIGLVLGPDPANNNGFKFKAKKSRVEGLKYFRVLHIDNNNYSIAGSTAAIVK